MSTIVEAPDTLARLKPEEMRGALPNPFLGLLQKQQEALKSRGTPGVKERDDALKTLAQAIGEYKDALIQAIQADFGHRSAHETILTEVIAPLAEIRFTRKKIRSWAKPKRLPLFSVLPGTRVVYQPKGVVGIMGAWNYPVMLTLSPLIGALAAGNHAMLKPSDLTPRTAETLKEMIAKHFDESCIAVVTGGLEAAVDFSRLPFDHLVYTGNTSIGRQVMQAAAANLTPVTLEMGGKSPAIIAEGYPVDKAVSRILMGKSVNAGQTCIAPDYVILPKSLEELFIEAFVHAATRRYPTLADNPDITWIVNDRHFQRVKALIEDARQKGATVIEVNPRQEEIPEGKRIIPLTLIAGVNDGMRVMQEEIFGPVLPIKTVGFVEEAIEYIKDRPRPLALYYFDADPERVRRVVEGTWSGGMCINDTMLHAGNLEAPFGGTGESGVGAYHGFYGFAEFSHKKTVHFASKRFSPAWLARGPYPKRVYGLMNWLAKRLTPKS